MQRSNENPHARYGIDDWNWEFLRRNPRYQRAYKGVQWLKARLHRKFFMPTACFNLFGMKFRFSQVDRGNGREWRYEGKANHSIYLNDLSSPDNPSSRRYKGKLIKKLEAITPFGSTLADDGCTPALLQEHEIAIRIDTRFTIKQILCSLQKLLVTTQPKKKLHVKKYKDYLTVWDLRQQGKTLNQIAAIVWPDEYKIKGGSDYVTAEKGVLVQRASDHEKAAAKLIDNSFPPKKHRK